MTLVAFRELTGWQHEMYECRSVDPQHRNEYENVYAEQVCETSRSFNTSLPSVIETFLVERVFT